MADNDFEAFKAMVQQQKNAEKPAKHIKFDPDAFGGDEKEETTEKPKHSHKRTTTEAILLQLAALGDEFNDIDEKEYDDAEVRSLSVSMPHKHIHKPTNTFRMKLFCTH